MCNRTCLPYVLLVLGLILPRPLLASDWKPIDPADLALKSPRVQPGADAEALLWEIKVGDDVDGRGELTTTFEHYLRVKIFSDRGREAFATVDIPYFTGVEVRDVAARTVRSNGSIVELKGSDVYRRTVVKGRDFKVQVVSFAVPAIEPGSLVEYRWREVYRDSIATNLRLPFSREIPAHEVSYYVRPLGIPGLVMQAFPFNGRFEPPEKQRDGSTRMTLLNVPADLSEDYGPPPFERRPWVFIFYNDASRARRPDSVEDFRKEMSKALHEEYGKRAKPNDEIRRLAAAATAGLPSLEARLAALARVTREKMKRVDTPSATAAERRAARQNRNAADALNRGFGTADDSVLLLMALATAAGLDARAAALPNRADLFPRSVQPHAAFVPGRVVAVKQADGWIFADPANQFAPAGELRWEYELQEALIGDPQGAIAAATPLSPAPFSKKRRVARLRLLADGTIEGEIRLEYTGHWADRFRRIESAQTPAEIEKSLRETYERRLPGIEISDVRLEHVADLDGPYANLFHLRVPGYAQRTGERLFLQPAFHQKGIAALFQPETRTSEIYLEHPWVEEDEVEIELPEGYALETPDRPRPIDVGPFTHEITMSVQTGSRLFVKRSAAFGKNGQILFPPTAYGPIRGAFDGIHRADQHTLVLKRKAP